MNRLIAFGLLFVQLLVTNVNGQNRYSLGKVLLMSHELNSFPSFLSLVHGIPDAEYNALYDLYYATDGTHWYHNGSVNWNFTSTAQPCAEAWDGITCSETSNETHVVDLRLNFFDMWGTIPDSFGNFTYLQWLDFHGNYLSGTLPDSFAQLTHLLVLNMSTNDLTGSFPAVLLSLTQLEYLNIDGNELSGSLPAEINQLSSLEQLLLSDNFLTGSIPDTITELELLQVLVLFENELTQTIPHNVGQLYNLRALDLYVNSLTGPIPESCGQLTKLEFLDLSWNQFSGTIPDVWWGVTSLARLHMSDNLLHGPVPPSFGAMANMSTLHLSANYFSGVLPPQIATFQHLKILLVEKNALSGALSDLIDASLQENLEVVLITGNRFTGTLPADLFRIPTMRSIHCDNNCLSGSIPENICDNPRLEVLSLNGLYTADSCRTILIPGYKDIYKLSHALRGTLPQCLFELPALQLLDLSSNGLSGPLPGGVNISKSFTELALAHNFLTGRIHPEFQDRTWKNLDLSYNRFCSEISHNIPTPADSSALKLRNNRLSGHIPQQLYFAQNISILPGNVFSCKVDKSDLPMNDDAHLTYQCGSTTFNDAYYAWLAMTVVAAVTMICLYSAQKAFSLCAQVRDAVLGAVENVRAVLDIRQLVGEDGKSLKHLLRRYKKIADISKLCLKLSVVVTMFVVVILLPTYSVLSTYYSTYTHKYAYKVAMVYLSGTVPAVLCMLLLLLLMIVTFLSFVYLLRNYRCSCTLFEREIGYSVDELSVRESASVKEDVFTREKLQVYAGTLIVDLIVVFGANIAFVVTVLKADDRALFAAQAALSMFKIAWSSVCASTVNHLAVTAQFQSRNLKKGLLFVLFLVTLFNNIVVPCLVVMAISTTCFYNMAEPSPPVYPQYVIEDCVAYEAKECDEGTYLIRSSNVEISPPFVYSYHCSASFLTAYAPSFVYMCIISSFVIPAGRHLLHLLAPRLLSSGSKWSHLLYDQIPRILLPISATSPVAQRYFDSRKLIIALLNNVGVLLTFGAVFPPLAVAILVTTLCRVCFTRLEIQRFLRCAAALNRSDLIERVDIDCAFVGSDSMLIRSVWVLVIMSCWFYALFLFDILGDDKGLNGAYWVLIVMFSLPVVVYAWFKIYTGTLFARRRDRVVSSLSHQSAAALELAVKLQQHAAMSMEVLSPMSAPGKSTGEDDNL